MKFIKTEEAGFIGTIVLNNDVKHNSLNLEMLDEIGGAIQSGAGSTCLEFGGNQHSKGAFLYCGTY